jgi:hypothetical protein
VIQDEFHDRKPRLQGETFGPRAARDRNTDSTSNPRMDSLPRSRSRDPPPRSQSRMDDTFRLTESDFSPHAHTNDFIDRQQASLLPPPSHSGGFHSHTNSLNTDLGAYPFSANANEVQWPVPPGYSESNHSWREGRESTVLGEGYGMLDFEGRDGAGEARNGGIQGTGVRRTPRRVHERSGWD